MERQTEKREEWRVGDESQCRISSRHAKPIDEYMMGAVIAV